jgi:glycosyltransferase involved in cell wall biosynthesis
LEAVMVRVDVFVPCYGYGHYLTQCVESALLEQSVDVRVLILDDASPDNTPDIGMELAARDARVTYVRHATNKGHIATYNEGIDWASGDYLLLLSADDFLLPGALARTTRLMENAPEVGFAFGKALVRHEDGSLEPVYPLGSAGGDRILSGYQFVDLSGATNIVPTPTAVVRSELQKSAGGYRRDLPHSGDQEMWLRLAARASVGYVDAELAVYRKHASNMSSAYFAAMLPDIEQRKAALDRFFNESAHLLPDAARLRGKLYAELAQLSVKQASIAFNNGDTELSRELSRLSRAMHPDIVSSAPWLRLSVKRGLGHRTWRAVSRLKHPLFARRESAD